MGEAQARGGCRERALGQVIVPTSCYANARLAPGIFYAALPQDELSTFATTHRLAQRQAPRTPIAAGNSSLEQGTIDSNGIDHAIMSHPVPRREPHRIRAD